METKQTTKQFSQTREQRIIQGECLEEMRNLEAGSVDLILTDPPYGTIKDLINPERPKSWGDKSYKEWDSIIDIEKMFEECNRILRPNGKLILFSQDPYTNELINKSLPSIPFGYRAIWLKDNFANALLVNKAMVNYTEDLLIFSKVHPKHDFEGFHPLRDYFKEIMDKIELNKKQIVEKVGQKADHCFRVNSTQFSLCTEKTYNELINIFNLKYKINLKSYSELKEIDYRYRNNLINEMNKKFPSIFNLWNGKAYKSNVLEYAKDPNSKRLHPTQKPVELLKDLIKTYSNEGDAVLDFTMGSGSTLIACQETNRKGIGIELDKKYFKIAEERITSACNENTKCKHIH